MSQFSNLSLKNFEAESEKQEKKNEKKEKKNFMIMWLLK